MDHIKIKQTRLYEQVIKQIEALYNEGKLKLGDKLPSERELSSSLGVSRGTLRDAFRILESQGVLETKAGGGRYLRKDIKTLRTSGSIIDDLQKSAMIDLLEAREILELGMIELVCERATDEDISKLEDTLDNTITSLRDSGASFNLALAECTKNITIINFMKLNMEILNHTRDLSFRGKESFEEAQREHRAILGAIKERNSELAKARVVEHLKNVRKRSTLHSAAKEEPSRAF